MRIRRATALYGSLGATVVLAGSLALGLQDAGAAPTTQPTSASHVLPSWVHWRHTPIKKDGRPCIIVWGDDHQRPRRLGASALICADRFGQLS